MLLDDDKTARLRLFESLLLKWNARINLISARDTEVVWTRHIQDSLRLAPFIAEESRVTDLGSGGGFPGIVLAVARNLDLTFVESDQRKCAFLREASRLLGIRTKVLCQRIESVDIEPAPFVTARALAPMTRLLGWTAPLLRSDGTALYLKGQNVQEEIREAQRAWSMRVNIVKEADAGDGVVVQVSNIQKNGS